MHEPQAAEKASNSVRSTFNGRSRIQNFMLPLLKLTGDGQVKALADLEDSVAPRVCLDGRRLARRVPSGKQTKLHNRVSWCSTYLKKAKLLETAGRLMWGNFVAEADAPQAGGSGRESRVRVACATGL